MELRHQGGWGRAASDHTSQSPGSLSLDSCQGGIQDAWGAGPESLGSLFGLATPACQHISTQLYQQLHAKDHGERAPHLGAPGQQKGTFTSCSEQMGNDSICVGFLINSKARARNGERLCTHMCSSGAEMLRLLTDRRSRAHPLCYPAKQRPDPQE